MTKHSNPVSESLYVPVKDLLTRAGRSLPGDSKILPPESTTPDSYPSPPGAPASETLRLVLPTRYTELEPPKPLSAFDDDPLFNPKAAGQILAVSTECLKKWRSRKRGPSYIQYGEDGPVRYVLSALMRFRAQHTVELERKR
jgi:hypothetical protein